LVIYFEGLVLDRENSERQAKGWKTRTSVGEDRRQSFLGNAVSLLEDHPLEEVTETVDWIFEKCKGLMPYSIKLKYNNDRKITRLRLVLNYYADIRKAMVSKSDVLASPVSPVEDLPQWQPTQSQVSPVRQLPKPTQSQIDELVAAFQEFRSSVGDRNVNDSRRTNNWAKTFRIRLNRYSFEEIKEVIEGLDPEIIDPGRYPNAFDFFDRDGEWEYLKAVAPYGKIVRARNAEMLQNA
jgi:hypothetical protein